jgi:hypothetical protein
VRLLSSKTHSDGALVKKRMNPNPLNGKGMTDMHL